MADDILKYYEVLGLQPGASLDEVKEAFRDLVKVWHPDRFAHDPKLQAKAQEKLKEINHAFQRIQEFLNNLHNYQQAIGTEEEEEKQTKTEETARENAGQYEDSGGRTKNSMPHDAPSPPKAETHPWVRFWARTLDIVLFSVPVLFLFRFLFPKFSAEILAWKQGAIGLFFLTLPFVVLLEAITIAILGSTPGKEILKVKIANEAGKELSFKDALKRGYYLYVVGYGLGFPGVYIFTYMWQYRRLKKQGKTSWDEAFNYSVTHGQNSAAGIIVYVILFIACSTVLGFSDIVLEKYSNIKSLNQRIPAAPVPMATEQAKVKKWVHFGGDANCNFFYDKLSMKEFNERVYVWIRMNCNNPNRVIDMRKKSNARTEGYKNFSNTMAKWEYDCTNQSMGTRASVDYDKGGKVLHSYDAKTSAEMKPIQAGTMGDTLFKIICLKNK